MPTTSETMCLTLAVRHGSLTDGDLYGTAHFLEHMLLEYDINGRNNTSVKGTTLFNKTIFEVICNNSKEDIDKALEILLNIASGNTLQSSNLEKVRADIVSEYKVVSANPTFRMYKKLVYNSGLSASMPIGDLTHIQDINFTDIIGSFKKGYTNSNMRLFIAGADSTMASKLLSPDNYWNETLAEYQCVFIKEENVNIDPILLDLLDRIALTVIEEIIISQWKLSADVISTNIIQYSTDYKFYKLMLNNKIKKQTSFSLLDLFKMDKNYSSLVEEVINAYKVSIQKDYIDEYSYLKHMIDCFTLNQPLYDNQDLRNYLNNISSDDIINHLNRILRDYNSYEFCVDI